MLNLLSRLLLSTLCFLAFTAHAAPESAPAAPAGEAAPFLSSAYRLGVGDIISIRVYGEDDMNRDKLRISDNGVIAFPFGDLVALNLTTSELAKRIEDGLRDRFLKNPSVSVTMEQYRNFYIYGQVEQPGGYPFQPGLTLRKAVSLAGGFKVRASTNKMFVVRETDPSQTLSRIDLNTPIWPGDTVTIEESFF